MTPLGIWDMDGPTSIYHDYSHSLTEEEVAAEVEKNRIKQL